MARHTIFRSSTSATRAVDAKNGDSVTQRSGVTTTVTDDYGIVGAGNNRITVNGTLDASLDAIQINGTSRNGNPDYTSGQTSTVTVGSRALVKSDSVGVNVSFDTLNLTNNGVIEGRSGVQLYQTANSVITNNGTIRSDLATDYGTGITVVSATNTSITNTGTIDFADRTAIYIYNDKVDGWDRPDVVNSGSISGYVVVGTQDGEVVNSGTINGTVIAANVDNTGSINGDIRLENDNGSYRGTGDINGSIASTYSSGMTIDLKGDLVSAGFGISLSNTDASTEEGADLTTRINISAQSDFTTQGEAINVAYDTVLLTNDGDISCGTGILVYSSDGSEIVNNGTIVRNGALEYGTGITVVSGSDNHIVNNGLIDFSSGGTAIYIGQVSNGDRPDVTNTGTIKGWVVSGTPESEIVNSGLIEGVVLVTNVINSGVIDGRTDGNRLINTGSVTDESKAEHVVNSGTLGSVRLLLKEAAGGYYDGRNGKVGSVTGSEGHDTILGGAGKEVLDGGAGNDLINGGRFHDTLTGGAGDDVFQFDRISGYDMVTDFENGDDLIDLSALGLKSFNALSKAISSNSDGDATIDLSQVNGSYRGIITLDGVSVAELDRSDFIF